ALQHLHLALEEREVFPLLEAELTETDWAEISANLPKHDDPVFESPDQIRFQTLVNYLKNT
ncbi:MAG: hemerythrin domain-containing protein, partial [Gammaproteobacteria bacterium]|nr:hemerythrin domain-containing protein [Gammaproteobacteria bacterium]